MKPEEHKQLLIEMAAAIHAELTRVEHGVQPEVTPAEFYDLCLGIVMGRLGLAIGPRPAIAKFRRTADGLEAALDLADANREPGRTN